MAVSRSPAPGSVTPDDAAARQPRALGDLALWRGLLVRWGISVASLVGGLVALVVFRRGVPRVGWIVGYVIVLWLTVTVLAQARGFIQRRAGGRTLAAGEYTVQTLYHGLLLFVLPGYFASTTFDGPTAPFFLFLAAAALLTTIDPWYAALLHPRPWLGRAFFVFASFAGLNVALPLIGVPPAEAVLLSAGLSALALAPAAITRDGGLSAALACLGTVLVTPALAWLGLPAIPPAPLHLVHATMARSIDGLTPVAPLPPVISAAALADGGLVAYTPVSAPAGLRQPILHRWRHRGRVIAIVTLPTPVLVGRLAGFRTYSRKTEFPHDPRGRWSVDVVTASGQLVGRLRFRVEP
jgi:hypothetical protein